MLGIEAKSFKGLRFQESRTGTRQWCLLLESAEEKARCYFVRQAQRPVWLQICGIVGFSCVFPPSFRVCVWCWVVRLRFACARVRTFDFSRERFFVREAKWGFVSASERAVRRLREPKKGPFGLSGDKKKLKYFSEAKEGISWWEMRNTKNSF